MPPLQAQGKSIHQPTGNQGAGDVEIQHRVEAHLRGKADEQGVQRLAPLIQKKFGMYEGPASVEVVVPAILTTFGPAPASVNKQEEQGAQRKPE